MKPEAGRRSEIFYELNKSAPCRDIAKMAKLAFMHRISTTKFSMLGALCLLAALVITMGLFLDLSWLVIGAATLLFMEACWVAWQGAGRMWGVALVWSCTLIAWGGVLLGDFPAYELNLYFAGLTGGVALAALLVGWKLPRGNIRSHWRLLGIVWGFMTGGIWLGVGYLSNLPAQFYIGVLINLALLVATKLAFQLPPIPVQFVNTLIVILIGLPLADRFVRPSYQLESRPDLRKQLYSYAEARKDPTAFGHWWYYFVREWHGTMKHICMPATNSAAPFRLRPGTEGMMFESRIRINRLGFRGPEIDREKGNAYRIVTLGESTTFGHTMYAEDVPWPRVLERMITNHLRPQRPVQVINAGIPSYTLHLNLERLHRRILALQPDMIISYHGYNGFNWLMPALPPATGKAPPEYQTRPLKLLGDAEYRLKVIAYLREREAHAVRTAAPVALLDNEYARGYRELIELARTNDIRLVLANYSMAVNAASDLDVVAFYRSGFPDVLAQIRANELHSQIVEILATAAPEVTFVNTHPQLDGQHEKFIDLVHFTQPGRNEMATAMFEAIKPVLEDQLGSPGG